MTTKLPRINYTAREFNPLVDALNQYIKDNYNEYYNEFFEAALGQALVDLLAYVGDGLHFYLDKRVNNLYWDTAERYDSLLRLCKLLGYVPTGAIAAKLNVIVDDGGYPDLSGGKDLEIKGAYWDGQDYVRGPQIEVDELFFEVLYDVVIKGALDPGDTESETLRIERVKNDASNEKFIDFFMYEGQTLSDIFTAKSSSAPDVKFQTFETTKGNIIEDSWSVCVNADVTSGVSNWVQAKGNSFLNHEASDKIYVVEYITGGRLRIRFGDGDTFGQLPPGLADITVAYRVGGGIQGNIISGTIQTTKHTIAPSYMIYNTLPAVTSIALENPSFLAQDLKIYGGAAVNGQEKESLELIRVRAPQSAKSGDRAVTLADTKAIAEKFYTVDQQGEPEFIVSKASARRTEDQYLYGATIQTTPGVFRNLLQREPVAFNSYPLVIQPDGSDEYVDIKINVPSHDLNIIEVFIWGYDSEGKVDYPNAALVLQLSDKLNKGDKDSEGQFLYNIGMVSVQYAVVAGTFVDVIIGLGTVYIDPVSDPNDITSEIKSLIEALFVGKNPGDTLYEIDVWRAVSSINGVLKFGITNLRTPSQSSGTINDITTTAAQVVLYDESLLSFTLEALVL